MTSGLVLTLKKPRTLFTSILLIFLFISIVYTRRLFPKSDNTTLSNFKEIITEHTVLDFNIDIPNKKVLGIAHYKFQCKQVSCTQITLDIKDINISKVYENLLESEHHYTNDINNFNLQYELFNTSHTEFKHSEGLRIFLERELYTNEEVYVSIEFNHIENNSSIVWLNKDQTDSGEFIYTMTKPINARSLFPCMDTPSVKSSYSSRIVTNEDYKVIFSGVFERIKKIGKRSKFYFSQRIPIPSFLVGFAIGRIKKQEISQRVLLFSEKHLVTKALTHLYHVDEYIIHIENYLTKFIWGKLNLVIMPKGFPNSGMGYANVIFLSHNILDDKEHLFYNLLHEIIESWIGNLITHSCWRHYALIKGLSTYIERRIIQEVDNKDISEVHKNQGEIELYSMLEELGFDHSLTSMYPDIRELEPSDYIRDIAHEKGFAFFSYLDQGVGRHVLRDNIKLLIKNFSSDSINYVDFADHYIDHIKNVFKFKHHGFLGQIDWDSWINKTGEPVLNTYYSSEIVEKLSDLISRMIHFSDADTIAKEFHNLPLLAKTTLLKRLNKFTISHQNNNDDNEENKSNNSNIRNLQYMEDKKNPKRHLDMTHSRVLSADTVKTLVKSVNKNNSVSNSASLKFETIMLGLKSRVDSFKDEAEKFINGSSEIKYLKKLYFELSKIDYKYAKNVYIKNRSKYIDSTRVVIEKLLKEGRKIS